MKKFRVLSDLHLDINANYPLDIVDKDIFSVICGDTSGSPSETIKWINENCPFGVGVSGNHLPYNNEEKTIQELREELAQAFPLNSSFTYLDCETGVCSKVVDGILFIGSCMYSDMRITHPIFNPTGNINLNMTASMSHMNDYHWGIKSKDYILGKDNDPKLVKLTAKDYANWFNNTFNEIDVVLNKNELQEKPFPVVLITHYNLIPNFLEHNLYLEYAYSLRTYNWPSYASDYLWWIKKHSSIKCYCCGHIHAVDKQHRNLTINRNDGTQCLVVNNARGYVNHGHDANFTPNLYVNVENWSIESDLK